MKKGAFALIDCLGFKGIWKREPKVDPELFIKKLSAIDSIINDPKDSIGINISARQAAGIETQIQLLSDTVAIGVSAKNPNDVHPLEGPGAQILYISYLVIKIMDLFLENPPCPMVMRGCISYGDFAFEQNFIVGEAVDRAAEHEKIANGAFVWLLPEAEEKVIEHVEKVMRLLQTNVRDLDPSIYDLVQSSLMNPLIGTKYPMPIKGGGVLRCPVVNPLALTESDEQRYLPISLYEAAMRDKRIDVLVKKQNTLEMLQAAAKLMNNIEANENQIRSTVSKISE